MFQVSDAPSLDGTAVFMHTLADLIILCYSVNFDLNLFNLTLSFCVYLETVF